LSIPVDGGGGGDLVGLIVNFYIKGPTDVQPVHEAQPGVNVDLSALLVDLLEPAEGKHFPLSVIHNICFKKTREMFYLKSVI
jgi:hypothetical protein